ncbi:hypothetical protein PLICRDRAFT_28389 [Plicaturopsis crispa FD-325 SS-3]|nr:hypothetical protein PLICRDRAFT_28389 [Plicaturopsis crispa FD-325 SS-3]
MKANLHGFRIMWVPNVLQIFVMPILTTVDCIRGLSVMLMFFAALSIQRDDLELPDDDICDVHVTCWVIYPGSCMCCICDSRSVMFMSLAAWSLQDDFDRLIVSSPKTYCIILSHWLGTFQAVSWSNFLMEHSFWCNGENFSDKIEEAVTDYKESSLPDLIDNMTWDPHPWPKTPDALQERWKNQNMHRPRQGMQKQSKSLWTKSQCLCKLGR